MKIANYQTMKRLGWIIGSLVVLMPHVAVGEINITPRVGTEFEYTDNLFLSENNESSDFITTLTSGLTLDLFQRNIGITLDYDASYVMYADHDDSDYWRHMAGFDGWWQISRYLRMELSNDFLRTRDPISGDDFTVRRSNDVYVRNTTMAQLTYQFGEDNSAYMIGEYGFLNNDDEALEDNKRYGGAVGLEYWLNTRWGIDLRGSFYEATYDYGVEDYTEWEGLFRLNHRVNPRLTGFMEYTHTWHQADHETQLDYQVYDGGIGFSYAFDPTMDLTMSVHYIVRNIENDDNESSTPVNVNFVKRFQRGSLTLSGEGGYQYTTMTAESLGAYRYYTAEAIADYYFLPRLFGDIQGTYSYQDYEDTSPHRQDDIYRVGCGVSYQITAWARIRAGYDYNVVQSTVGTNEYKENRVLLMFFLAPEQPYRF